MVTGLVKTGPSPLPMSAGDWAGAHRQRRSASRQDRPVLVIDLGDAHKLKSGDRVGRESGAHERHRQLAAVEHRRGAGHARGDEFGHAEIIGDPVEPERQKLAALQFGHAAVPVRQPLRRDRGQGGEDDAH